MQPISTTSRDRLDWKDIKDRIDLAAVATNLLGPAAKRSGRRLLWRCPFHEDHDPSFQVDPATHRWRCWPCDKGGDAPALVMQLEGLSFPEAVRRVADRAGIVVAPSGRPAKAGWPGGGRARGFSAPADTPGGLSPSEALALVEESERRLGTPEGRPALEYLTRVRGLTDATIRRHRLGWVRSVSLSNADATRYWQAGGITIPWFDAGRLGRVKIRQPDGRKPRYAQVYSDRPGIYPGRESIRRGLPLIAVEGEFDALLLAQELGDLAGVFTAGGASGPIDRAIAMAMWTDRPGWFAAHDADDAGDAAAARWSNLAVRVRPPAGKDWTDAMKAGIDLRLWWIERHFPDEFDREERAAIRQFDGDSIAERLEEDRRQEPAPTGDVADEADLL